MMQSYYLNIEIQKKGLPFSGQPHVLLMTYLVGTGVPVGTVVLAVMYFAAA